MRWKRKGESLLTFPINSLTACCSPSYAHHFLVAAHTRPMNAFIFSSSSSSLLIECNDIQFAIAFEHVILRRKRWQRTNNNSSPLPSHRWLLSFDGHRPSTSFCIHEIISIYTVLQKEGEAGAGSSVIFYDQSKTRCVFFFFFFFSPLLFPL